MAIDGLNGDKLRMPQIKLFNNLDQTVVELEVPCRFGREDGELTFPSDDSVSTLHGEFQTAQGSVYILDLSSTNGTYLNDHLLEANQKTVLQDDDLLEFGEQSFHIGVSDQFSIENISERYNEKKTERLRQMLNTNKVEKLNTIKNKIKTLESKKKQITMQLNSIKDKYKKGKAAERSLVEKKTSIDHNINNFPTIMASKNKAFDNEKRTLFKQKTDLDDKIKLLNLSGDKSESEVNQYKNELEGVKVKISKLAQDKKDFPHKINDLKKNQKVMDQMIKDTASKLRKVEFIIKENEDKYHPILEKIEIQLKQLEREMAKLNESVDATKTRQL